MRESQLPSGKYAPLYEHLAHLPAHITRTVLTFDEIEAIIQDRLPPSAYKHVAFWANAPDRHYHARAWLDAGWQTSEPSENLGKQRVVFLRR